ncbi:MAG TPA: DUF4350 domain-containing protein [Rhizobacter sp.]|nr:DUF4350 domain-containing protein [Rhizobacter sp.]
MSPSTRDWLMRALLVAAMGVVAVWVASCTEWAEVEVPLPERGEAAKNELYATQQLLRRLGSTVAAPTHLAQMPPPQATLMLSSWYWDLFPERAQRLKAWVEGGGHLVLYASSLQHRQLKDWLPIKPVAPPRKPGRPEDADEDDDEADQEPPPAGLRAKAPPCADAVEPDTVPSAYTDGKRHFKVCGSGFEFPGPQLQSRSDPLWLVQGAKGPLVLRAAVGRGQVTVVRAPDLFDNRIVVKGDNALVAVAALKGGPGAHVWFVTEEARPPILRWLWREAWVVVVLGALALALALWRSARRFGPLMAVPAPGRRSIAEQISGTAQFLHRQGPEALLAAQFRALEAAARSHVRHYDQLDRSQRAAAIAKMTGQDASALTSAFSRALDTRLSRRRTDLPATLELLETARRLLVQRRPHTASTK